MKETNIKIHCYTLSLEARKKRLRTEEIIRLPKRKIWNISVGIAFKYRKTQHELNCTKWNSKVKRRTGFVAQ